MSPDRQYVSLAGKPSGELWLVDYRQPEGSTHRQLRPPGSHAPLFLNLGDITCPPDYADALKISGATFVDLAVGHLTGGTEDCVDVNHSHSVNLRVERFVPRGRYVATIKGGTSNFTCRFGTIEGTPRYVDFDLGNWSDQSKSPTTQILLVAEGKPQPRAWTCRQLHAARPDLAGVWSLTAPWWRPLFYPVYGLLKKLRLA